MSNCTPCTPANDELPIFCDPFPATDTAKRILVEDEAFCQKALNIPTTTNQILKTNASGNIQWGTVNSVLQSGPVDLGNQPMTTTGEVTAKTIAITNPSATTALTINQSFGNKIEFFHPNNGDMVFNGGSDGIFAFSNTSLAGTRGTCFVGANVGILTLTPTASLHVAGTAKVDGLTTLGNIAITAASTASTVGGAGGASALPATPSGYIQISINGTPYKLPYYPV